MKLGRETRITIGFLAFYGMIVAFGLFNFAKYVHTEKVETLMVEVEVVASDTQGKHKSIDIKDLTTNKIYKDISISGHKVSNKENALVGVVFLATRITRKYPNQNNRLEVSWDDIESGVEWIYGR